MINELDTLYNELVDFVAKAVPKAQQTSKYGGVLFSLKPEEKEGQFCGVFLYKTHVQLSFSKGVQLDDTRGVKLAGSGKYRRHINFESSESIDVKLLEKMIVRSSKL